MVNDNDSFKVCLSSFKEVIFQASSVAVAIFIHVDMFWNKKIDGLYAAKEKFVPKGAIENMPPSLRNFMQWLDAK